MKKIDEIIEKLVNATEDERLYLGKETFNKLAENLFSYGYTEDDVSNLMINLVKYFVGMDGACSYKEYELVRDILEIDIKYSELTFMTINLDKKFLKTMEKVILKFEEKDRVLIASLGLTIISSDKEITKEEKKYISKICK